MSSVSSSKSGDSQEIQKTHELLTLLGAINPENAKKSSLYIVEKKGSFETAGKLSTGQFVVLATKKELGKTKIITSNTMEILSKIGKTFEEKKVLKGQKDIEAVAAWYGARTVYQMGKKNEKGYSLFAAFFMKLFSFFVRTKNLDTTYATLSKQFREYLIEELKEAVDMSMQDLEISSNGLPPLWKVLTEVGTEKDVREMFVCLRDKLVENNQAHGGPFAVDKESQIKEIEKILATVFLKEAVEHKRYDLMQYFVDNYDPVIDHHLLYTIAMRQDERSAKLLGIHKDSYLKALFLKIAYVSSGILGSKKMLSLLKPSDNLIKTVVQNIQARAQNDANNNFDV